MKTAYLITLVALYLLTAPLPSSAITIEGRILNPTIDQIRLKLLFGPHHVIEKEISISLSKGGKFRQEIAIKTYRFANLVTGEQEVGLFLDPDVKKISFTLDCKAPAGIQFKGKNSRVSAFAYYWLKKRFYLEYESINPEEKEDPDKFYAYCGRESAKELEKLNRLHEFMGPNIYELWQKEINDYFLAMKLHGGFSKGYHDQDKYNPSWMDRNDHLLSRISCDHRYDYLPSYNFVLAAYEGHEKKKMNIDLQKGDTTKWVDAFAVSNMDELFKVTYIDSYNKPLYVMAKDWTCREGLTKSLANRIMRSGTALAGDRELF